MSKMNAKANNSLFYRRCHICDSVTGGREPVLKCGACGKHMAPFFFFDVRQSLIYSDLPLDRNKSTDKYKPIEGLTVYW